MSLGHKAHTHTHTCKFNVADVEAGESSQALLNSPGNLNSSDNAEANAQLPPTTGQLDSVQAEETVDEVLERMGFTRTHWFLFLATGLLWSADAMSVMLMSFLGPAARCEWDLSPTAESLLSSAVFGGMLLGAGAWGAYADYIGRRVAVLLSCVLTSVFGVLSALATNFSMLLIARTAMGFGLASAPAAFILLKEWTPPRLRSPCMVVYNGWWTAGTVVMALLAWSLLDSHGWRVVMVISSIPQMIVLATFPILPESPALLVAKEHHHRLTTARSSSLTTTLAHPPPAPTMASRIASWCTWLDWVGRKLGVLCADPTLGGVPRAHALLLSAGANSKQTHRLGLPLAQQHSGYTRCAAEQPESSGSLGGLGVGGRAGGGGAASQGVPSNRGGMNEGGPPPAFSVGRLVVAHHSQAADGAATPEGHFSERANGAEPTEGHWPRSASGAEPTEGHGSASADGPVGRGCHRFHASDIDASTGVVEDTARTGGLASPGGMLPCSTQDKTGVGSDRGDNLAPEDSNGVMEQRKDRESSPEDSGRVLEQRRDRGSEALTGGSIGDGREGGARPCSEGRPEESRDAGSAQRLLSGHEPSIEHSQGDGVLDGGLADHKSERGRGADGRTSFEESARGGKTKGRGQGGAHGVGGGSDGGSDGGKAARLARHTYTWRSKARNPLANLLNRSTALVMLSMLFVWFTNACAYYGITMLAVSLNMPSNATQLPQPSPLSPPLSPHILTPSPPFPLSSGLPPPFSSPLPPPSLFAAQLEARSPNLAHSANSLGSQTPDQLGAAPGPDLRQLAESQGAQSETSVQHASEGRAAPELGPAVLQVMPRRLRATNGLSLVQKQEVSSVQQQAEASLGQVMSSAWQQAEGSLELQREPGSLLRRQALLGQQQGLKTQQHHSGVAVKQKQHHSGGTVKQHHQFGVSIKQQLQLGGLFIRKSLFERQQDCGDPKFFSDGPAVDTACSGPGGTLSLPSSTYIDVILAALAEVPSVLMCLLAVGGSARPSTAHRPVAGFLYGTALAMGICAVARALNWEAKTAGRIVVGGVFFFGRFLIASAYFLLYIYTPMLLPTQVRAFGMGICNAISRLGGMAAPLVAVDLVAVGMSQVSLGVFSGLCLASGVLMTIIGARTQGRELQG